MAIDKYLTQFMLFLCRIPNKSLSKQPYMSSESVLPELNTIFTAEALHIMQKEGKVEANKGKLVQLTTLILVLWHTLTTTGF